MGKNVENTLSYKIGYGFGTLVRKILGGVFKLLWRGIKTAFKNIYVASVYVFLVTATIVSYLIIGDIGVMLMITLSVIAGIGVWSYIKERPIRRRINYFFELFEKIDLVSSDDIAPLYLGEAEISDYLLSVSFNTTIPLRVWEQKREELETLMNVKIIDIAQNKSNFQIVHLIIETQAIPEWVDWNDRFIDNKGDTLNIGMGYYGVVGMDLEKQPHAFIAGETGSGKSNILKCLIHQTLLKEYDVILIDFKRGVSFSIFNDYVTVYYEYKTVIQVLNDMVNETNNRLDKFRNSYVDNINDYNRHSSDYLNRKIIFIDELAELLRTRDRDTANRLNDSVETLTRLSRAVGIHLIMGLQRPDSTIISGQIKNNVSFRVCGRFVDREPSRIMLGDDIASNLPNIKGRFIVKDDNFYEIQAFYFMGDRSTNYKRQRKSEVKEESQPAIKAQPVIKKPKQKEETPGNFEFDFSDIKKKPAVRPQPATSSVKATQTADNVVVLPVASKPIPEPETPAIRLPAPVSTYEEKGLEVEELEIIASLKVVNNRLEKHKNILLREQALRAEGNPIVHNPEYQADIKRHEEVTYNLADNYLEKMYLLFLDVFDRQVDNKEILQKRNKPYLINMIHLAKLLRKRHTDTEMHDEMIKRLSDIRSLLAES